ncbi:MAG: 2Fe-2S iron-sulfur cluster binding domain-containing protein [Bacteroidetes bacterium]|nr:2Fe-2S iron-sulfur cluster binding domain-containing protein [Bacteroidota bacterium]
MVFKKLFGKKGGKKPHRGYHSIEISAIKILSTDCVQVSFDIPKNLKEEFSYIPGQFLDFIITLNGKEHRRSYSICSGANEPLSVAVKQIKKGVVSTWFNTTAQVGMKVSIAHPQGTFIRTPEMKNIVAFAAGSGITPIMAIAKSLPADASMNLFFGNKTLDSTLFWEEIKSIETLKPQLFLSQESNKIAKDGRLDEKNVSNLLKENLDLLKADAFFLCGPSEMIEVVKAKLELLGVDNSKIKYELFTAPVKSKKGKIIVADSMESKVTVLLDGEEIDINFVPNGKSIIELLDVKGYDPPYSCRGGVCSTCRAIVTEGTATMRMNYVLTDEEVAQGHILCCQAVPTSEAVTISFDE